MRVLLNAQWIYAHAAYPRAFAIKSLRDVAHDVVDHAAPTAAAAGLVNDLVFVDAAFTDKRSGQQAVEEQECERSQSGGDEPLAADGVNRSITPKE
jgi:hypothetical protein